MAVGLFNRAIAAAMPFVPRPLVWRFSRRYIAGVDLDDAYRTVRELNASDCSATIDVLGEDSTNPDEVKSAVELYLQAIRDIDAKSLRCGISVKLSELGLRFDVDGCRQATRSLIACAADHGRFVRIDMEDSSVTSVTLDIYREMRREFDNVGIVIQSCLRRSERDIAELMDEGATDVRLCKGIYIEPEAIAFVDPDEIRKSFNNLLEQLFEGGARRVAIATHDPLLVEHAEAVIEKLGVGDDRYEFQMLLGVAGSLRRELVDRGHPMRVYVPFGDRWYAYSMRRLRENPNIAGHVVGNLLSRS
ncbi:MAG TPA: proline dehydrogenase family protein [Woeseiaceae bacterium]|nr:proline dehydrogenase family protein [Woeseiaceae bacterium]